MDHMRLRQPSHSYLNGSHETETANELVDGLYVDLLHFESSPVIVNSRAEIVADKSNIEKNLTYIHLER